MSIIGKDFHSYTKNLVSNHSFAAVSYKKEILIVSKKISSLQMRGDNSNKVILMKECVMNLPTLQYSKTTSPVTPFFLILFIKHIIKAIFSYLI